MASDESAMEISLPAFEAMAARLADVRTALEGIVFGQSEPIAEVLITLLAGGHNLLVGAPGLAKTRLVAAIADLTGLAHRRVQFTPDLMPADILGTEILEQASDGHRQFRFIEGPVFCQLLMADEINRASPRTQSALLEAMQERQVTIAGKRRALPAPFHVLATQNPIEQEGTYPLPEAQLDRFMLQTHIDYPDEAAERRMLALTTAGPEIMPPAMLDPATLQTAQAMVRAVPIGAGLIDDILKLVRAARPGGKYAKALAWGPGPRASQALSLCVRARALLEGRPAPGHEDLFALAPAALRHRMALTFTARAEGQSTDGLVQEMLASIG